MRNILLLLFAIPLIVSCGCNKDILKECTERYQPELDSCKVLCQFALPNYQEGETLTFDISISGATNPVEMSLEEYFADLLYKIEIKGKESYIYVLFESHFLHSRAGFDVTCTH